MILENGVIRTLDPSLPSVSSLWIAGERIAGGVGVHETSLPTTDSVNLGGRCVLPGFTDSHVHFPTWALSRHDVRLHGCASVAEALDRVREAPRTGSWVRGQGWRDADWPDGPPTRQALDEVVSDRPAMLISKDYHALWLNSAALSLAGGDLEVDGGVVVRDERGEPTGVLDEEAAWQFKGRFVQVPAEEYVDAMRAGVKVAASRGVTALHDKDGWLGAIGLWQQLEQQGSLPLRVWQSTPAERLPELRDIGLRSGVGSPLLRLGYLKTFMDGTLGSQTAWMTGRQRRRDHVERGARADRARRRGGGLAGRRPCDRRRGEPRGARRLRALARRVAAARPAPADRTCAVPRPRGRRRASPSSGSPSRCSSHTPPPTRSSRSASGPTASTARTRSARSSTRERCSRTDPTRPWRSSSRGPVSIAAVLDHWREDQRLTLDAGAPRGLRRPHVAVARRARSRDARPRPLRRPRRTRPRPVRVRAGRAPRRAGRRDDARRPLDTQPTALGLMTQHRISRDQVIWSFGPDLEPVLEVEPGDVVTFETNDCFTGQIRSEDDLVTEIDFRGSTARPALSRSRARSRATRSWPRSSTSGRSSGASRR